MVGGDVRVGRAGVVDEVGALARPDLGANVSTANSSSSSGRRVALGGEGSATSSWPCGAYQARVSERVTIATTSKTFTKIPIFVNLALVLKEERSVLMEVRGEND